MKKIAWLDCSNGVAGNMILGALIDLGFPEPRIKNLARIMKLGPVRFEIKRTKRAGLDGVLVRVIPGAKQKERNFGEIKRIIGQAQIPESVKTKSIDCFQKLAEVEAKVHSVKTNQVHFHELGALDTIIDIVGSILGFYELGIEEVYANRIRLGGGEVRCEHGLLPVPAPATLALLKGLPVLGGEEREGELTTPTGAVLVKKLAKDFGAMPEMVVEKIGYGAGERELNTRANLLRIVLGKSEYQAQVLVKIEATIDDMNPEFYEPLMATLFKVGALEVALIPAQMKKNRPGIILHTLCHLTGLEKVIDTILVHSTTNGVRFYEVSRIALLPEQEIIKTKHGKVRVKRMEYLGKQRIHPEFEDLKRIAEQAGISLLELEQEVKNQWLKREKARRS